MIVQFPVILLACCIGGLATANTINNLESESSLLDNKNRIERCHKPRREKLRLADGQQVVKYFLNGGPTLGASHFINKDTECSTEVNNSDATVSTKQANVEPYQRILRDVPPNHTPMLGSVHNPAYVVPTGNSPVTTIPVISTSPIIGLASPILSRRLRRFHPHIPKYILGSVLHPQGPVLGTSNSLLRMISHPFQAFVHMVHSLTDTPGNIATVGSNSLVAGRSAETPSSTVPNSEMIGASSPLGIGIPQYAYLNPLLNLFHPQPKGYMLQLVPHDYTVAAPTPNDKSSTLNCLQANTDSLDKTDSSNKDQSISTKTVASVVTPAFTLSFSR